MCVIITRCAIDPHLEILFLLTLVRRQVRLLGQREKCTLEAGGDSVCCSRTLQQDKWSSLMAYTRPLRLKEDVPPHFTTCGPRLSAHVHVCTVYCILTGVCCMCWRSKVLWEHDSLKVYMMFCDFILMLHYQKAIKNAVQGSNLRVIEFHLLPQA